MKGTKRFWPWGHATKAKQFEDALLESVPPSWAGPLMVMNASFFTFACLWFVIAKRPTSRRIMHKYKLQTALEDCYTQFDPKSGSSHRFFKAELATRVASSVHARHDCVGDVYCIPSRFALHFSRWQHCERKIELRFALLSDHTCPHLTDPCSSVFAVTARLCASSTSTASLRTSSGTHCPGHSSTFPSQWRISSAIYSSAPSR